MEREREREEEDGKREGERGIVAEGNAGRGFWACQQYITAFYRPGSSA